MIQQRSDDAEIIAWSELHGWNPSDVESHRLLARQALLNAVIRQIFPALTFYRTPFVVELRNDTPVSVVAAYTTSTL